MRNIFFQLNIIALSLIFSISLNSCKDNKILDDNNSKPINRLLAHTPIDGEEDILSFYEQNEVPYKEEQPYTFIINKYLDLANNYFGETESPYYIVNPVTYDKELTFITLYETYNDSYEMTDLGATPMDNYFNYLYEMMNDEMNQMSVIQEYAEIARTLSEAGGEEYMEIEDDEPTISIGGVPYSKLSLLYAYENNILLPFEIEDDHVDEDEYFEPVPIEEIPGGVAYGDSIIQFSPRRALMYRWVALWPRKIRYRNYKNKCPNLTCMQSSMQQWSNADNNYVYFSQIADNGWNRFTWGIGCNYHLCLSLETDPNCAGCASVGCVPWATIKLSPSAQERSYLHELGHVLCLQHEVQRADRNYYVRVHYDRIKNGYKSNFWKYSTCQALPLGLFNFSSIMMYHPYAFSKPDSGQTIERIEGDPYYYLGNGLSDHDKLCIKVIYHP